jgi:hypothetical protein
MLGARLAQGAASDLDAREEHRLLVRHRMLLHGAGCVMKAVNADAETRCLESVMIGPKRAWTNPLDYGKVASVEKDACPGLAGVAGDERAGDRRGHHHVTSHADAERQACASADQRAQPPASGRRFPDASGEAHDLLFGHAPCGKAIFGHTQDEDVPVDRFERAVGPLAAPQQHHNMRAGHRGKIRKP